MKSICLVLALASASASAASHRGWLTGAGVMLAKAGAAAMTIGGYHAAQGEAAAQAVTSYYANGAAPTAAEASTVRWLQERTEGQSTLGVGLLISGGAALVLGISMVLFDGWVGGASVSLSVQPARATLLISGTF